MDYDLFTLCQSFIIIVCRGLNTLSKIFTEYFIAFWGTFQKTPIHLLIYPNNTISKMGK